MLFELRNHLRSLAGVAACLGALAVAPAAQTCPQPDGLTGPCCAPVAPNLPQFPGIALPASGFCWNACVLSQQTCLRVNMGTPAPSGCAQFTAPLAVDDCNGVTLLSGVITLDYTRTWLEVDGTGLDTQVWRFVAKIDFTGSFQQTPQCPVPPGLGTAVLPTEFFYGYVDYARPCIVPAPPFEAALVLFHNCDLFTHGTTSAFPGVFHPGTTFAIVAPDTPTNPFLVVDTLPPAGPIVAEAMRTVTPVGAANCIAEDPVTGNMLPFFHLCACPLSPFPPHNTLTHMDGVGTCVDPAGLSGSFRSVALLGSFPALPWIEVVGTSIGRWTTAASYPGPEEVNVQEGLFRYFDPCPTLPGTGGSNSLDIFYGASTRAGYPVIAAAGGPITQDFTDLASNFSKRAGTAVAPPFHGRVMPTTHLIYVNTP